MLSTLSETILEHVVGLCTSCQVWMTFGKMFSAQSQARVMQFHYELATLKKAQTLAHTIAAICEPLKDSDLILYLLVGLGSDYEPLITSITTRIDLFLLMISLGIY